MTEVLHNLHEHHHAGTTPDKTSVFKYVNITLPGTNTGTRFRLMVSSLVDANSNNCFLIKLNKSVDWSGKSHIRVDGVELVRGLTGRAHVHRRNAGASPIYIISRSLRNSGPPSPLPLPAAMIHTQ